MYVSAINYYIHTQMALGNWPERSFFSGDDALLGLVDTYDTIAGWDAELGPWDD